MPFPELFEWLDIAIKDNQSEHQKKPKPPQKKAETAAKRRGR
jgi:hypothetical protein